MEFVGQFHEQQQEMKLDVIDRKIVYLLSQNARFSDSSIAKALKTSKEVVHYRIKRMQKEGFLCGFITLVADRALGQVVNTVDLQLHPGFEPAELVQKLVSDSRVSHVKHYNTQLDLQFGVTTNSAHEFAAFFEIFLEQHHRIIKDYTISIILEESYTGLDFILDGIKDLPLVAERKGSSFQKEFMDAPEHDYLPDEKDRTILNALRLNARLPLLQLAQKVHLAAPSVQRRISAMVQSRVIKAFIPYAQFSYLGYQWHTLHLRTKNLSQEQLLQFLRQHPNGVWLSRRLGKWNYHVTIFARNNTEFNAVVQELCRTFREHIIAYDSSIVFKQYKYNQRVG